MGRRGFDEQYLQQLDQQGYVQCGTCAACLSVNVSLQACMNPLLKHNNVTAPILPMATPVLTTAAAVDATDDVIVTYCELIQDTS